MFLSVGEAKTELKEFVLDMKQTKLMLKQDASLKAIEFLQQQTTVVSSAAFYGLAKLYELPSLAESAFSYMERCFAMVAETPNFLQLDHRALLKVLASSNLRVDSETEVHDAAVAWLSSRSSGERSERALRLLLKVRLPLLSTPTLKYLSRKASPFTENKDCVSVLEEVSGGMQTFYPKKPTVRCCSQNAFDLLLFGGYDSGCKKEVASVRRIRGRCGAPKIFPPSGESAGGIPSGFFEWRRLLFRRQTRLLAVPDGNRKILYRHWRLGASG